MNAKFAGWEEIIITGNDDGRVRIDLSEMEKGSYNMVITYLTHTKGGVFSVWQRQKRISENIDTYSAQPGKISSTEIGEIQINDFYNSVTLEMEPPAEERELRIRRLMFIK